MKVYEGYYTPAAHARAVFLETFDKDGQYNSLIPTSACGLRAGMFGSDAGTCIWFRVSDTHPDRHTKYGSLKEKDGITVALPLMSDGAIMEWAKWVIGHVWERFDEWASKRKAAECRGTQSERKE